MHIKQYYANKCCDHYKTKEENWVDKSAVLLTYLSFGSCTCSSKGMPLIKQTDKEKTTKHKILLISFFLWLMQGAAAISLIVSLNSSVTFFQVKVGYMEPCSEVLAYVSFLSYFIFVNTPSTDMEHEGNFLIPTALRIE